MFWPITSSLPKKSCSTVHEEVQVVVLRILYKTKRNLINNPQTELSGGIKGPKLSFKIHRLKRKKETGHLLKSSQKKREESSVWTLLEIPYLQGRMMLIVLCIPADAWGQWEGVKVFKFHLSPSTPLRWGAAMNRVYWGAGQYRRGGATMRRLLTVATPVHWGMLNVSPPTRLS